MVSFFIQYYFALPISKEEAYDKIYEWYQGLKGTKFNKKTTKRPDYIQLQQGSAMAGGYKPHVKKKTLINLWDDPAKLKGFNCDDSVKSVFKLQCYPASAGAMTKKMHLKMRKIYREQFFNTLFDDLGGTPMQVKIGGEKTGHNKKEWITVDFCNGPKKPRSIFATADGSFPEDYAWPDK